MSEEKKPDYLGSIQSYCKLNEELFEVQTVNGFVFQQEIIPFANTNTTFSIGYSPTEIQTIMTPQGPRLALATNPRFISFYSKTDLDNIKVNLFFHSIQKMVAVKISPVNALKVSAKFIRYRTNPIRPQLKMAVMNKFFNVCGIAETEGTSSLSHATLKVMIGRPVLAAGFMLMHIPEKPIGYNFVVHHQNDSQKSSVMYAYVHNSNGSLAQHVIRMRRQITENWTAAVAYQVNKSLYSQFNLAWKANIGKSFVHSSFNTMGDMKTKYSYRISPSFRFGMSAYISHTEKSYRFGTFLLWDVPDDSKK
ncbi:hypothetical protein TRFO_15751 [Tritrichomonas foetus]|uniref:Eukaryotic porin family protein n=1 Tax=Tritrichomonas foetus TaxID=1144522 RepID=A0A1J4KSA0_9EUKA|nr:hypothetical protein TRFO_15751 [Tritrichomonas foetus]|eukprot:OHT13978.1 hypothetical protein TRFO_15751 [Tritrichomonas foetus]